MDPLEVSWPPHSRSARLDALVRDVLRLAPAERVPAKLGLAPEAWHALLRHLADDGNRLMHAHLTINGGSLMLNDDFPEFREGGGDVPAPGGVTLHIQVPDADAVWGNALAAGATVKFPLEDQFWGDRYGQLEDPFGFTWSIGGPRT